MPKYANMILKIKEREKEIEREVAWVTKWLFTITIVNIGQGQYFFAKYLFPQIKVQ